MAAPQPILHHYWPSPFSEKVRLIFGLKQIGWGSVLIPPIMPKPDYTPLTGGYRRTPSLQVGADIYCDTHTIVEYLERRFPSPSLFGDAPSGMSHAVTAWAENKLFWPIARYVMGVNADEVGPAFMADRAAMRGQPPTPPEKIKAAAPYSLPEIHIQLGWIEDMLRQSGAYVLGAAPSLADMSIYHCVWFLGVLPVSAVSLLDTYPATVEWMARMKALGHGTAQKMKSQEAWAIAASADPEPFLPSEEPPAIPLGTEVGVRALEFGTDVVQGELVSIGPNHVTLLRKEVEGLGDLAVHFPRFQYLVKPM